jgi:hypothetical protein
MRWGDPTSPPDILLTLDAQDGLLGDDLVQTRPSGSGAEMIPSGVAPFPELAIGLRPASRYSASGMALPEIGHCR